MRELAEAQKVLVQGRENPKWDALEATIVSLNNNVGKLSNQLDTLRREVE